MNKNENPKLFNFSIFLSIVHTNEAASSRTFSCRPLNDLDCSVWALSSTIRKNVAIVALWIAQPYLKAATSVQIIRNQEITFAYKNFTHLRLRFEDSSPFLKCHSDLHLNFRLWQHGKYKQQTNLLTSVFIWIPWHGILGHLSWWKIIPQKFWD